MTDINEDDVASQGSNKDKANDPIPSARSAEDTGRFASPVTESGNTVHIRIPKANTQLISPIGDNAPPFVQAADSEADGNRQKKETSKIPLATALGKTPTIRATPSADGPVKTIRIRPKSASPQAAPETPAANEAEADAAAAKKKTSRISLDAALTSEQSDFPASDSVRPKTIRLKRPTIDSSTARIIPQSAAQESAQESAQDSQGAGRLQETSRIEAPAVLRSAATPTQRRTIRVKRPTPSGGVSIAAPADQSGKTLKKIVAVRPGAASAVAAAVPAPTQKEPNVIFPIFAIAAMIVLLVTIYVFCAQAIGPNSTFTQYSYAPEGPDLGWPGKIQPVHHSRL